MADNFWKKLKKPIMAIAPMSGVTDEPFRLMFLKYGKPSFFWTEFTSAEGLFSKGREACLRVLKFSPKERPIIAQIFGANPDDFERAAKLIADLGFDGVDINMGCPDSNIEKKGAGKMPVSVKTRIGYDKNQIDEWIPAILKENIAALTVHFRTKKEMYLAPAHWELAKEIVKLRDKYSPETLILGNGDVGSLAEAKRLVKETGLDGVVVGRSVLGNPWFFLASPKLGSEGGSAYSPTILERLNAVIEHAEIFDDFHKEDVGKKDYHKKFASIKKHFHAYTKGFRGAKEVRDSLMNVKNTKETKKVISDFLKKIS